MEELDHLMGLVRPSSCNIQTLVDILLLHNAAQWNHKIHCEICLANVNSDHRITHRLLQHNP